VITIFVVTPSTSGAALQKSLILPILYLLLIPTIMPSTLAAYSVVGEREQGTLEPLLTTPIRQQEFLLGKATSVMIPTLALSYTLFGVFLGAVRLFANSAVASAVFHDSPVILALLLLAPLMAGWGIVVGMAVSVRATEVRVAQQLGTLASLPPVAVIILLAVGVVSPTFFVAIAFAVGLLVIDALLAIRLRDVRSGAPGDGSQSRLGTLAPVSVTGI
jgi:ABC-2 type transport system permease protein